MNLLFLRKYFINKMNNDNENLFAYKMRFIIEL